MEQSNSASYLLSNHIARVRDLVTKEDSDKRLQVKYKHVKLAMDSLYWRLYILIKIYDVQIIGRHMGLCCSGVL